MDRKDSVFVPVASASVSVAEVASAVLVVLVGLLGCALWQGAVGRAAVYASCFAQFAGRSPTGGGSESRLMPATKHGQGWLRAF